MNAKEAALYEEFKEKLTKAYYGQAALVAEKEKLEGQLEKIENKLAEKSDVKDLMDNKKWVNGIIKEVTQQYQSKLRAIKKTRAKTKGTALEKTNEADRKEILITIFEENDFAPLEGKILKSKLQSLTGEDGKPRRVISPAAALSQWLEPLKIGSKAKVNKVPGKPTRGINYVPKEMDFVKVYIAQKKK